MAQFILPPPPRSGAGTGGWVEPMPSPWTGPIGGGEPAEPPPPPPPPSTGPGIGGAILPPWQALGSNWHPQGTYGVRMLPTDTFVSVWNLTNNLQQAGTLSRENWAQAMSELRIPGMPQFADFWALVWDYSGGNHNVLNLLDMNNGLANLSRGYQSAWNALTQPGGQQNGWDWFNQSPQAANQTAGEYWNPVTGTISQTQMLTQPWSPPPNLFSQMPESTTGWYYDWTNQQWTTEPTNATTQFVPFPWKVSAATWNSLGPTGQALLKGAAEAAGWDWTEYVYRMQQAWPTGTSPSQTLTTYQDLRRY